MNKFDKIGKVEITEKVLHDLTFEELSFFYSIIHPISITWGHDCRATLTCLSRYFDSIGEGETIPRYEVTILKNFDSGNIKIQIENDEEVLACISNNFGELYTRE